MDIRNDIHQIGTNDGMIKGWFPRTDLLRVEATNIIQEVPKEKLLSLREAARYQSLSDGQGYQKCNCKISGNQCKTKRCKCFNNNVSCNFRCHLSSTCFNKNSKPIL